MKQAPPQPPSDAEMQIRMWGCIVIVCGGFWALMLKLLFMNRGW